MKIGFLGCGKIGRALLKQVADGDLDQVCFVQDPFAEEGAIHAAAPGVPAQDQHGVVILALPFAADAGLYAVAVVDAVPRLGAVCVGAVSLSGQFRLDEQAVQCHHGYQHHRQYDGHRQQPLLPLCQSAGLLCFLLFGFLLF